MTLAALTAAICLVVVARASAGPYVVRACDDAASGRADGWLQARTASAEQLGFAAVCPSGTPDPYGALENGLAVGDVINAWNEGAPDGAYAEWRFSAPPGTAIVAARVARDIGNRDEWTPYARVDEVDVVGESCVPGMGEAFCRIQGTRTFTGLNATSLAYGIRCVTAPYCAHLWDLRAVWVLVLGATVTLDDREAPTVSAVDSSGLADGKWWNRAGAVSFAGRDNTGIRRRAVVVDGVVRAVFDAPGAAEGGCRDVGLGDAYSYVRPCADHRGLNGSRLLSVNPCGWGDGAHGVRGRVTDTGGLEAVSSVAVSVRVDCTAPVVSIGGAGPEVVEGEIVEPAVAASDSASGLATTEVEVRVDDGDWVPHRATMTAEAGRVYAFRARAADVAGNWTAWAQSATTLGVPAPEPPPSEHEPQEAEPQPPRQPGGQPQPAAPLDGLAEHGAIGAPPVERLVDPAAPEAPTPQPQPQPQPHKQAAALRITRVLVHPRRSGARAVTIAGTAARTLTTRATLTIRTNHTIHRRRVAIRNGRWRARVRIPARARLREVVLTTAATATHAPGRARYWAGLAHHPAQ